MLGMQLFKHLESLSIAVLAYTACFVDCDGSIHARIRQPEDRVLGFDIAVSIQFSQLTKRRHYLEEIQSSLKCGTIRDRKLTEGRSNTMSDYVINSREEVRAVLLALLPYLRIKRAQADLALELLELLPLVNNDPIKFIEAAKLTDRIASLNDSKNRSNTSELVIATFRAKGWVKDQD